MSELFFDAAAIAAGGLLLVVIAAVCWPRRLKRAGRPGEVCHCGRPASIVWRSPHFDELGSCGRWDHSRVDPCPFCGIHGAHPGGVVCPAYRVRPEWAQAGHDAAEAVELRAAGGIR